MSQSQPSRQALPFLRAWRVRRGYSQRELAQLAGVSKTTIVSLEGAKARANFVSLGKIAHALNISREQLLYSDPQLATLITPLGGDHAPLLAR